MKMNKWATSLQVVVLIISLFLAVSAYAKSKDKPQQLLSADEIVAKMMKQLGLTDQQAIEVKAIIEDHIAQEKQLMLDEKKQLSKVLTGDQMYTWNFLQSETSRDKKKHASLF